MRVAILSLAMLCAVGLSAATLSPEEQKTQAEFKKAYNNPDKSARTTAISMLDGAKHSSSWALLDGVSKSDPDADVRLAAFTSLAKEPARDSSLARMLAMTYSSIKINDIDTRIAYAKAMGGSEFKADIVNVIGDQLTKMRYPDIPRLIQTQNAGGTSDNRRQIEAAKKQRKEFEDLLEAFNAIAKSELTSPTKDTPLTMRKWLDANLAKLAKEDRDLADKYRKEDAEAAKAKK